MTEDDWEFLRGSWLDPEWPDYERIVLPARDYRRLFRIIDNLRAELIGAYEGCVQSSGLYQLYGAYKGWWSSLGSPFACWAGDRLVEIGAWEAHPENEPTNWQRWYRRKVERKEPT